MTKRKGEEGSATTTTTDTSEESMHIISTCDMSAGLDEIVLADKFNYLLKRLLWLMGEVPIWQNNTQLGPNVFGQ